MELTSYAAIVVITAALRVAAQSAPDLPDDFNGSTETASTVEKSPGVSPATAPTLKSPVEVDTPTITFESVAQSGPVATLYTSDGSFRCGGCEQQERILSAGNVSSELYVVQRVSADVAAAMGGVPRWEPFDKSRTFPGVMSESRLQAWLKQLQAFRDESTPISCQVLVAKDGSSVFAGAAAALVMHLSDEAAQQPVQSLLNIDVDTPDSVNALVFDLLSAGKWTYEPAGLAFDWSGSSRTITTVSQKITLNPPAKITLTKWRAKWTAALNAVQYDTAAKTVTLELSGAPDLTVRFR